MSDDITPQPDEEHSTPSDDAVETESASASEEVVAFIGEAMQALYEFGDVNEALTLLEEAAQLAPDDVMVHFSQGITHYMAGDYPAMIASLTKVIERDPENFISYSMRATAHLMMENSALALADLDIAIGLEPDNHDLLKQRAILHAINEDYAAALADVEQALMLAPEVGELYFFRADLHYKLGDQDAALTDVEKSIARDPREPAPRRLRAEIWLEQEKYEQSRAAFEELNQLEPGAEYVHVGMALARHALGEVEEAQKMWLLLINAIDAQYADPDWVADRLGWKGALVDRVRQLIATL